MKISTLKTLIFSFKLTLLGLYAVAQPAEKILKVRYTSSPVSQYYITAERMVSTPTKASSYAFREGIVDYYSLYVNLGDQSSVYVRDSTTQVRPIGWEKGVTAALLDTVLFTLKSKAHKTYKHEWIMNQIFFSEGKVGDIKWELQPDSQEVAGLKCFKAISLNYPMLTVWYTKDIPVINGPGIFQGVPGLILWAEDYFRTVNVLAISYQDEVDMFNKLYNGKYQLFAKEKERNKFYDNEPLVLIKKGDLALGSYEYFHKKKYKK